MDPSYLDFLYGLGEFNIKLGLETIRTMLDRLGNPHRHPRIIHIAGTNGKGSTLITLERLLIESGFSTGSTISPHLISINERFRVNGRSVAEDDLNEAFREVCRACGIPLDLSSPVSADGLVRPTYFEFVQAIAFVLFNRAGVDYMLLETGLGGRLDASNVVEKPLACVITKIAMDHQEYLGDTITAIAREKLGILKADSPVVLAPQIDSVHELVERHCESQGFDLYCSPRDFFRERHAGGTRIGIRDFTRNESESAGVLFFQVNETGLPGEHQKDNIMTALATYLHTVAPACQLNETGVAEVLKHLHWPGRLQYLGNAEDVLLDGAHNTSGMVAMMDYLEATHGDQTILFATGWMTNKDLVSAFDHPLCQRMRFIPIEIDSHRAIKRKCIRHALRSRNLAVLEGGSCAELVKRKQSGRLPEHELLVVAGSLYLVGEFLDFWQKEIDEANRRFA